MLQKTFGIYADELGGCTLFIEAGLQHVACWCKDAETGAVKGFEFFQFDADDANNISNVFHDIKLHSKLMDAGLQASIVIWDVEDALCVPAGFYRDDLAGQYLDIMMGEKTGVTILTQPLNGQVVISRQPVTYAGSLKKQFPGVAFTHKFSLLLKRYFKTATEGQNENKAYVVFYPSHFILTIIKNNVLQVMRSIRYSTSDDVLYNIMQICRLHDMAPETTAVVASGLIDSTSNLYNTLYSYLEHFTLEPQGAAVFAAGSFADYPAHYFLPFICE